MPSARGSSSKAAGKAASAPSASGFGSGSVPVLGANTSGSVSVSSPGAKSSGVRKPLAAISGNVKRPADDSQPSAVKPKAKRSRLVASNDDDDEEYVPPPAPEDEDDSEYDNNDDDHGDEEPESDFDDEDCIDYVDVKPEEQDLAKEFFADGTEVGPRASTFSRKHIRTTINRMYNRLQGHDMHLCDNQRRVFKLIKAVILGVVDATEHNGESVHYSHRLFFAALRKENIQEKFAWLCAVMVLPIVLTKLGAVKTFGVKDIIQAFEEIFQDASSQRLGSKSNPRQGGYFWTFCNKDKKMVLVYIGESRQQLIRHDDHHGLLELASTGQYTKSWYPRAGKQEIWRHGVLFDLTDHMDELGFLGIFFQRSLEAAFCMILRTLPARAKEANGHIIISVASVQLVNDVMQMDEVTQYLPLGNGLTGLNSNFPLAQPIRGLRWHTDELQILQAVYKQCRDPDSDIQNKRPPFVERCLKLLRDWHSGRSDKRFRLKRSEEAIIQKARKLRLDFNQFGLINPAGGDRVAEGTRCYQCWYLNLPCDNVKPCCGSCGKNGDGCHRFNYTLEQYNAEREYRLALNGKVDDEPLRKCFTCWRRNNFCVDLGDSESKCAPCKHLNDMGHGASCKPKKLTYEEYAARIAAATAGSDQKQRCYACWLRGLYCDHTSPQCGACELAADEKGVLYHTKCVLMNETDFKKEKSRRDSTKQDDTSSQQGAVPRRCYSCWLRCNPGCDNQKPRCGDCVAKGASKHCRLFDLSRAEFDFEKARRDTANPIHDAVEETRKCFACWNNSLPCDNVQPKCTSCKGSSAKHARNCQIYSMTQDEYRTEKLKRQADANAAKQVVTKKCYTCWQNNNQCDGQQPKCGRCTARGKNCQLYDMTKAEFEAEKAKRGTGKTKTAPAKTTKAKK